MTTATARELKLNNPDARIIVGDGVTEHVSPIFLNNPDIARLADVQAGEEIIWLKDYPAHRPYCKPIKPGDKKLRFTNFTARPGRIYFSKEERQWAAETTGCIGDFIVIEPNVKGEFSGLNKDWGFEKWQEVVDRISHEKLIVQLGDENARRLKNVHHLVTPDFRRACAVLKKAALFAGTEGGLHHAAAALDVHAVVVFGGRISPRTTGYPSHRNLYVKRWGSPCGMIRPCRHCKKCMDKISVEQVVQSIRDTMSTQTDKI